MKTYKVKIEGTVATKDMADCLATLAAHFTVALMEWNRSARDGIDRSITTEKSGSFVGTTEIERI